jgi:hypothetical protein
MGTCSLAPARVIDIDTNQLSNQVPPMTNCCACLSRAHGTAKVPVAVACILPTTKYDMVDESGTMSGTRGEDA